MNHPTPTIGRIVYYRGSDGFTRPAIVTAVHGQFSLNLYVFPKDSMDPVMGGIHENVTHADPEREPGCLNSWHWMPYQIDQAKKAESNLKAASSQTIGDQINKSLRAEALNQALRTPGVDGHADVLIAARAYVDYIIGTDHTEPRI